MICDEDPLRRRPRESTARRKRQERCVWMARKMTEWPSKRGPITKIMPSDGCIGDTVPLAVGKWYDFHEFGWYMGNVGLLVLLFAGVLAIFAKPATAQQTFTRSITFCAVDMDFAEMARFVKRIREFHEKANHDIPRKYLRERLTLQGNSVELELIDDFSKKALEYGPKIATKLSYIMSMRRASPISEIYLALGDYQRKITISGRDRDLVDGLLLLVNQEIGRSGCAFGGSKLRSWFGINLFLLASTLAWMPFVLWRLPQFGGTRPRVQAICSLLSSGTSIALLTIVFVLPWGDWLPGTTIRKHPTSTWDQIYPFLTVFGILIAVAGLTLSLLLFLRSTNNKSDD